MQRQRETKTVKQRGGQTERGKKRDRDRQRERDRERERVLYAQQTGTIDSRR